MYNFFLIGNQKTNINDKKIRGKYTMFMMMNNKKKKKEQTAQQENGNQETRLREDINSEREQS